MENVTEALKIAFGVMMFVLALTLSISCFSDARTAIDSIITMRDREQEYTYLETSKDTKNRSVSAETIIPTIYKAYKENFRIEFRKNVDRDNDGELDPLYLYNYIDPNKKETIGVYYIDLEKEILPDAKEAIDHFNILLGSRPVPTQKYFEQFIYEEGLYEFFTKNKFEEKLGEYYQEDALKGYVTDTLEINKTKKRVITYILQ